MKTAVGENIRRLRQERGLTQEALGERLSVTRQTVSQWERGVAYPDVATLQRVAETMDVGLLTVLYGAEEPPENRGVFPGPGQQRIFYAVLLLSLVGTALPWFSFDPQMCGYAWGCGLLPYLIAPLGFAAGMAYSMQRPRFWTDAAIVLLLLSAPALYLYEFFTWYTMTVTDGSFAVSLSVTYPGYWVSLTLSFLPPLLYPFCRMGRKKQKKNADGKKPE